MLTDAELLAKYSSAGSESAFAEIVRRHLDAVYSSALRRVGGDRQLAEDISQQVFSTLARNAGPLTTHPLLIGWLYRSTRNAAANLVRTEQRRKQREAEAAAMNDSLSIPAAEPDWNRVAAVLDTVIDQLGESDRRAILLRFIDRRAFAEVGQRLGVSEDAARMRVERALEKLRQRLARRGVRSSAAALSLALGEHAVLAAPTGLAGSIAAASVTAATVAGGSGAATFGVVQLMTKTKLSILIASAIALVAALSLTGWEIRNRANAEADLAAARRDFAAESDQLRLAQSNLISQAQKLSAAKPASARAEAVPENDPAAAGKAFLSRHPEVRRALEDYARARINSTYGPLFKALNLTPAQIDRFQELMMSRYVQTTRDSNGLAAVFRPGPDAVDGSNTGGSLRELLGQSGWKTYLDYSHTTDARDFTIGVAGELWASGSPLSPDQSEQLVQLLRQTRSNENHGGPLLSQHFLPIATYDWAALNEKAQQFLTPPQMEALKDASADGQLNEVFGRAAFFSKP